MNVSRISSAMCGRLSKVTMSITSLRAQAALSGVVAPCWKQGATTPHNVVCIGSGIKCVDR